MKKTLLTIAATSGIAFAGFAGVASAQSYGDAEPTATTVVAEEEASTGVSTLQTAEDEAESTEDSERHGRRGGCNLDAAAEAIGIDADELRTAVDEGQSIAEVATANGVDAGDVVDAMVAAKAERLAEKVDEGRLTPDEADERLVEETTEIEDRVSGSTDEEAGS